MLSGTTVHCAVLFVDVARSTELRRLRGDVAAGAAIAQLLERLVALVAEQRGEIIKSDGDDLIAVFTQEGSAASDAAHTAVQAQQQAQEHGLSLYAGLHVGEVNFFTLLGRRDIQGLAVNMAARLHKLVPDEPGAIYLAAETATLLDPELRQNLSTYGNRQLKGIGEVAVYRLEWGGCQTVMPTQYADTSTQMALSSLLVRAAGQEFRLFAGGAEFVVGRSRSQAQLLVDGPVVSSRHLVFSCQGARWQVRDVSRNGSWLRDAAGSPGQSFKGEALLLPASGQICLGRSFANDADGSLTLQFETLSVTSP